MRIRMRWCVPLLVLVLSAGLAGCGQDVFAGGQTARVDGRVTDEPDAGGSSAQPAVRASRAAGASTVVDGTVELTARLELVSEGGAAVPITEGVATAVLSIASSDGAPLGSNPEVPVGSYPRARITFTRVEADLTGEIGLPRTVVVDLGEPLVVERQIGLRLSEDEHRTVVVDLNAASWVVLAVGGVLPPEAFAAALEVRVE